MSSTTYSAGDILLTDVPFSDQVGQKRRPILVVSTAAYNRRMDHVIFCPITTTTVPLANYRAVELAQGNLHPSNVITDTVHTVAQGRIVKRLGIATETLLKAVLLDVHRNIELPSKPPAKPDPAKG